MLKRHYCRAPAGIAFEDRVKMHPACLPDKPGLALAVLLA
jgi:hypothetical protein